MFMDSNNILALDVYTPQYLTRKVTQLDFEWINSLKKICYVVIWVL